MICLQFSVFCMQRHKDLSQMFPAFICFAASCRSSRSCASAEGWSFRPLRASWGMLSHSSIPPAPTTLWESCLGENSWSCRLSRTWFTSSWNPTKLFCNAFRDSARRIELWLTLSQVWMSSGCCSHPPWAGGRSGQQEGGALAAASKYLDESGSQWRWPHGNFMITLIDTTDAFSSDLDLKVRGQLKVNEEHLCHRCVFGDKTQPCGRLSPFARTRLV